MARRGPWELARTCQSRTACMLAVHAMHGGLTAASSTRVLGESRPRCARRARKLRPCPAAACTPGVHGTSCIHRWPFNSVALDCEVQDCVRSQPSTPPEACQPDPTPRARSWSPSANGSSTQKSEHVCRRGISRSPCWLLTARMLRKAAIVKWSLVLYPTSPAHPTVTHKAACMIFVPEG